MFSILIADARAIRSFQIFNLTGVNHAQEDYEPDSFFS